MIRLIWVALLLALVLVLFVWAAASIARSFSPDGADSTEVVGDKLQKIAFLLLLALIAYAAGTGMS